MTPISLPSGSERTARRLLSATEYCRRFGFEPDTDSAALGLATLIQQELARRAFLDEQGDFHVPPTPPECKGPCRGWDGVSERCDCGSRLLRWRRFGQYPSAEIYIIDGTCGTCTARWQTVCFSCGAHFCLRCFRAHEGDGC